MLYSIIALDLSLEKLATIFSILESIAVILGIIFILIQINQARKELRLSSIGSVFQLYNREKFLNARRDVLSQIAEYEGKPLPESLLHKMEHTSAVYNRLGAMVQSNLVDKELVLKLFSANIIRAYQIIEPRLEEARECRNEPDYMMFFGDLYKISKKYREEKYPELKYFEKIPEPE